MSLMLQVSLKIAKPVILAVCLLLQHGYSSSSGGKDNEDRRERLQEDQSYFRCLMSLIDDDDILDHDESLIDVYLTSHYSPLANFGCRSHQFAKVNWFILA
mmetsp:Transcript_3630/g.7260  ORF Transcript_3630/g.7260 Transcript_3630/m.7260 type:complete len:101 (-) Transcript_3630:67-369(-)